LIEDAQVHTFLIYVLYRGEWSDLGAGHVDLGKMFLIPIE